MAVVKNGEAREKQSFCDKCRKRASQIVGDRVLCTEHAKNVKQASALPSLADAGLAFRDRHR